MAMAMNTTANSMCKQCAKSFDKGTHCIGCEGFCSSFFHIECVQFSKEEYVCDLKLKNVWWICDGCRTIMQEMKSSRSKPDPEKELNSNPPDARTKFDLFDEEIATLKEQIAAIHDTLANVSPAHTTATSDALKEDVPLAQSSILSASQLMCGTRNTGNTTCTPIANRMPIGKYWLFFTKVKNSVTEMQMRMVTDCLGTDDVVVKKLVPAWKDTSSMPFISFKVGIGVRFKEVAQCPSSWPKGLCYREFHDNVWEPPQYDRRCTS